MSSAVPSVRISRASTENDSRRSISGFDGEADRPPSTKGTESGGAGDAWDPSDPRSSFRAPTPVTPLSNQSSASTPFLSPDETAVDPLSLQILQRTGRTRSIHSRGLSYGEDSTSTPATAVAGAGGSGSGIVSVGSASSIANKEHKEHNEPGLAKRPSVASGGTGTASHVSGGVATPSDEVLQRQKSNFIRDARRHGSGGLFSKLKHHIRGELDESSFDDVSREDGNHARPFVVAKHADESASSLHEPVSYIRIHTNGKAPGDFSRLVLAQTLQNTAPDSGPLPASMENHPFGPSRRRYSAETLASSASAATADQAAGSGRPSGGGGVNGGAIWTLKFSHDGKYLASGGQDGVLRVWSVLSSREERQNFRDSEAQKPLRSVLNVPVFSDAPYRVYTGHTSDILDISWSRSGFVISSSMDRTVRLWHISRPECLCNFKHSDFVTSIAFHPRDDRFFLSGSLDCKLRLWSIAEKRVYYWNELPELITAVAFTPDGRHAIAGTYVGMCLFYETDGLRYHTQIHVRSTRGKNAKGSKVTGIECVTNYSTAVAGEVKVLVTTNDSRIRSYNFRDKTLELKFKGSVNTCSQIHASFCQSLSYVISGSEDQQVWIWSAKPNLGGRKDKIRYDHFVANDSIVTCALFAPEGTARLLEASQDPIYDLVARNHVDTPSPAAFDYGSTDPTTNLARATSHFLHDESLGPVPASGTSSSSACQREIGDMSHDIIVAADDRGNIKIFRQDHAASIRQEIKTGSGTVAHRKFWMHRTFSTTSVDAPSSRKGGSGDTSTSNSSSESSSDGASSMVELEGQAPVLRRRSMIDPSLSSQKDQMDENLEGLTRLLEDPNEFSAINFYNRAGGGIGGNDKEGALRSERLRNGGDTVDSADSNSSTFMTKDGDGDSDSKSGNKDDDELSEDDENFDPTGDAITCYRCDGSLFRAVRKPDLSAADTSIVLVCARCEYVIL